MKKGEAGKIWGENCLKSFETTKHCFGKRQLGKIKSKCRWKKKYGNVNTEDWYDQEIDEYFWKFSHIEKEEKVIRNNEVWNEKDALRKDCLEGLQIYTK